MEKVRKFSQQELEDVYAIWFRGYDNISTLLKRLEMPSDKDKELVTCVNSLLDSLDDMLYEFFKPE